MGNKVLLVASLVVIVVVIVASWFVIQKSSTTSYSTPTTFTTPIITPTTQATPTTSLALVEKTFTNDAFEARVLYPKDIEPGQEIIIEIYAEAKNDYELSGVVIRAYPHTLPGFVFEEGDKVIYENSTKFSPPVKKFSTLYRIKLPEDLEGLGLGIFITPIKSGEPIVVHYSEPIIINIEVKGVTPKTETRTLTLPLITTSIELPPRPWSDLSISTDKKVYEVGEYVKITLTNKGNRVVRIKPSIPWVICPYNPEENRISYFCIYEPPRDDKWIVLNPGTSITWIWNQTSTWGITVKPGHYAVVLGKDITIWVEENSIGISGIISDINATFTIVKSK